MVVRCSLRIIFVLVGLGCVDKGRVIVSDSVAILRSSFKFFWSILFFLLCSSTSNPKNKISSFLNLLYVDTAVNMGVCI